MVETILYLFGPLLGTILYLFGPFVVVMLLPGRRTWFVALVAYFGFLWAAWPRCETSGDVSCSFAYGMFSFAATAFGVALFAIGVQLFLLPWQQWWVRIYMGIGAVLLAAALYPFVW